MFRNLVYIVGLVLILSAASCAGGKGSATPTDPMSGDPASVSLSPNPLLTAAGAAEADAGRYLWGYWEISYDPVTEKFEAVPVRETQIHLNVLRFLEDTLCETCLVIGDNSINPDGDLEVQIGIIHPITTDGQYKKEVFAGFDVRGIAIFDGSYYYDENGVKMSYNPNDEYTLVEPDGYTTLWSPAKFPPDPEGRPIFQYYPAKYEVGGVNLTTTLNPFMAFYTMAERRTFEAAGHDERTFTIRFPGIPVPLKFGYAVDASWVKPANIDNPAVPGDFPLTANCWEAYRITAVPNGDITPIGGLMNLILRVYDWQGATTISSVTVEAPDLFNGLVTATFEQALPNFAEYSAQITNELGAAIGSYPILIAAADINAIPIVGKIDAYQVFFVDVVAPLELLKTVSMNQFPIEGNFNPTNGACYFAPIIGAPNKEVQGIDTNYNVINGFPPVLSAGGMGLAVNTQEIFLSTDTGGAPWTEDVTIYDIPSKDEKWTLNVPSAFGNPASTPIDFAVYDDYNEVWVSLYSDNQVAMFSADTQNPVLTRVGVGTGPTTLAVDSTNYRVFIACDGNDTISVIDGFTHDLSATIDLENPLESPDPQLPATVGMAYVESLNMLFIATMLNGTVDYYSLDDNLFKGSIELSTGADAIVGLVYDEGADVLLATSFATSGKGDLYAIDPGTKTLLFQTDTSGMNPSFPGLDPVKHILYVPDPIGLVDIFKIIV